MSDVEERARRYEALVENMPLGVVSYRFDDRREHLTLVHANARAERFTKIPLRQHLGEDVTRVFPGIEQTPFLSMCRQILADGAPIEEKDGRYEHDQGRGVYEAVFYRSGPDEVTVVFADVTERVDALEASRQMQQRAEHEERRFRAIFENAPVMINSFGEDGKPLLWNRECVRRLGYSHEEVSALEHPLSAFYPDPAAQARVIERIGKADGKFRDYDVLAKSGELRHQRWADFALPDGSRISVGHDDTEIRRSFDLLRAVENELRQTNAELERSNRELEQFAYVVSHDLNEPLRMIAGFINRIEKRYGAGLDEDGQRFLKYVSDGARRLQTMLDDILSLSRMNQKERTYQLESLDEVLDEAISIVGELADGAVVRPRPLPEVFGDRGQLVRMFVNLLSNAVKFRSERPLRVEVSAETRDASHVVRVADNGVGFDNRLADRMFRMFDRLDAPRELDGSGIGLAVVAKVAGLHGGEVWAEGRPNEGASFFVSFPRVRSQV